MPTYLVFWFRRQLVSVRKVTHEASSLSPEVRLELCSLNIQDYLPRSARCYAVHAVANSWLVATNHET